LDIVKMFAHYLGCQIFCLPNIKQIFLLTIAFGMYMKDTHASLGQSKILYSEN